MKENDVDYILHLAAILSSLGEKEPELAYDVNVTGATNALNIARDHECQLFLPSSIAVFGGPNFPKEDTPDDTVLQPKTIYGISKVFNELLGEYYVDRYNLDFRSLRFPGVISSEKFAFNGTTDYSTGKQSLFSIWYIYGCGVPAKEQKCSHAFNKIYLIDGIYIGMDVFSNIFDHF